MWLLLLFAGILLLWLFQNLIYRHFWHKVLSVKTTFISNYIYEGDSSTIQEIIKNDKLLPLSAVSVRIAMSRNLEFKNSAKENSSTSDQTSKRDMFSFLTRQQITRTLPFVAKKRGYYQITQADLSGYDYFFHQSGHLSFPQQNELYVYPKPLEHSRICLISQTLSGMMAAKNRLFFDPFEFSGIREYRRDDPMNHINWKASARIGELMVNQYDSTTSFDVSIIFDLEMANRWDSEDLLEESISIAASISDDLVAHHMPVRLLCNANDPFTGEPLTFNQPAGAGNMAGLNQRLARIDLTQPCIRLETLLTQENSHHRTGQTYLFISKNHSTEWEEKLKALVEMQNILLWVMPVHTGIYEKPYHSDTFDILHWEVSK